MWILAAIFAHTLFAASAVGDKLLFSSRTIKAPAAYAALVGVLGALILLITPFLGFPILGVKPIIVAALAGALFVLALFPYFIGLSKYEASRIIPAVGGFVPLFTLLFTIMFVPGGASLSLWDMISFVLMVGGAVALTLEPGVKITQSSLRYSILASALFGGFFTVSKLAYNMQPFWSGLLWSRLGGALIAFASLCIPFIWKDLYKSGKGDKSSRHPIFLVLLVQAVGALASVSESIAVYLAPIHYVSFVNAIQGVQYAIILVVGMFLARFVPRLWSEKITGSAIRTKVLGVLSIIVGLFMLTSNA